MAPQQEDIIDATSKTQSEERTKLSRSDRSAVNNKKCERIIHYLRHGKQPSGLTKNEQRVVRGQAKNYVLAETSKEICDKFNSIKC